MHPSLVSQAANFVKRSLRARLSKRQEEEKKDRPRKHTVLNENSAGVDESSESGTLRRGAPNSAFALDDAGIAALVPFQLFGTNPSSAFGPGGEGTLWRHFGLKKLERR